MSRKQPLATGCYWPEAAALKRPLLAGSDLPRKAAMGRFLTLTTGRKRPIAVDHTRRVTTRQLPLATAGAYRSALASSRSGNHLSMAIQLELPV